MKRELADGLAGDHVVHLAPLERRFASPIASAEIGLHGGAGRLPPLRNPTIPDDLYHRIIGERTSQKLEGCEVAAANDDSS